MGHLTFQYLKCGVTQGSILGPLLFNVFVNDMVNARSPECDLYLYADDSAIVVSGVARLATPVKAAG